MPTNARALTYTQHQVTPYAGWDRVASVEQVLRELDYGHFASPATLCDAMMRDDRIGAVRRTRVGGLLACPLEFQPPGQRRKERKIAELWGGVDGVPPLWPQAFSPAVLASLVDWGFMCGVGIAEIIWSSSVVMGRRMWMPRLRLWHPQWVRWDQMQRCYQVQAQEGTINLPRIDEQPRSDGKWLIWTPFGFEGGWRQCHLKALGIMYLARQWARRDRSRYSETHGQGIRVADVPASAGQEEKDAFFNEVMNAGSDGVVMAQKQGGPDGVDFDVRLVEAQAKTYEVFEAEISELSTSIAINILGQNLTTEMQEGSLAGIKVQNAVRIDKKREDAALGHVLYEQVLTWWAQYNYGDPDLAPRPVWQVEPPDDELADATATKTHCEAVSAAKNAGIPIDVRAYADAHGIPMLSEEEVEAEEAVAAEERQAQGQPPTGGEPGGEEPAQGEGKAQLRAPVLPNVVRRYSFQGFPIAVENPAGTLRIWRDATGSGLTIGSTKMLHDYGFIEGYLSGDGEELDVYVGPDEEAREVHVVHQLKGPNFKSHDEDKVFVGFPSADAARAAFIAHRNDGDRAIGGMTSMPLERFRDKLKRRSAEATGKIRASSAATAAILRLVERSGTAAMARTPSGKRRAEKYHDRLTRNAQRMAARALAVDVGGMMEDVNAATSWDDLRERAVRRYKNMDPAKLARIVERTYLLAKLAGRLDAIKEL